MKITSKSKVKYDATLVIVSILIHGREEAMRVTNYFMLNSLLCSSETTSDRGAPLNGLAFTVRCTEEQLTMLILHFG